eukprot:TRINITY_DN68589_c0_g1_i1.p1 TRINITY_DN68589_c0_g1~~TRINITY_DN68589_c0_g1_i1.p1  ORF type:complete len:156 (+),score=23.79 TRINITY_DN68589_c0_g1_i1:97-564(+)
MLQIFVDACGKKVLYCIDDNHWSAMDWAVEGSRVDFIDELIRLDPELAIEQDFRSYNHISKAFDKCFMYESSDEVFEALIRSVGWRKHFSSWSTITTTDSKPFIPYILRVWTKQCARVLWTLDTRCSHQQYLNTFWGCDNVIKRTMKWIDTIPWR